MVLRSTAQLEQAIAENPFLSEGTGEDFLHLAFLAEKPKNADKLDQQRSPGDRFVVRGAGNLSAPSEWRRQLPIDQRVFRLEVRHREHHTQLADGAEGCAR